MKTKITVLAITAVIALGMLTGCGMVAPQLPDISDEEYDQVVEYATWLLMKYDKNHENSLVELSEIMEEEAAESIPADQETADVEEGEETRSPQEPQVVDLTLPASLTEIMAIDGIEFQYAGYEVDDFYPKDVNSGDIYFVINASGNNKLLILNFDLTNNSGGDIYLDMNQKNVKFKVAYNGNASKNALLTMLTNDMASYQGDIAAGEIVRLVVVNEIPQTDENRIGSVSLTVKNSEGSTAIELTD